MSGPTVSRRGLFGAALRDVVRARVDAPVPAAAAPAAAEVERLDLTPLESLWAPVSGRLLDAVGVDDPLIVRSPGLAELDGVEGESAAGVVSAFGVVEARDLRGAAAALHHVLAPGGRLVLATWTSAGAMGAILRAARKAGRLGGRPERWGTYDGLRLALERFGSFDMTDEEMVWRFDDDAALLRALGDPPLELVEPFVGREGGGVDLHVAWSLVVAERD